MMFNINKKYKCSNGSAMTIAIVAIALFLIFIPYMTKQLTTQLKSTMTLYDEVRKKYLTEAGIEKSILEIEEQVKEYVENNVSGNSTVTEVIEIPSYDITIDDSDTINFHEYTSDTDESKMYITIQDGKVTSINPTNINIYAKASNYEIKANVVFRYIYKGSSYYIENTINSYTRVN